MHWAQYVTLKYLFASYFVCIYGDRFYEMQKGEMDVVSVRITFCAMHLRGERTLFVWIEIEKEKCVEWKREGEGETK